MLIKLKQFVELPTKNINGVVIGTQYKNKAQDVANLTERIVHHHNLIKGVAAIDGFNWSKNRMVDCEQVMAQYRNEPYCENIEQYTEPLLINPVWEAKTLEIVNNVWTTLYNKNIIQSDHPLFIKDDYSYINDKWMYTANHEDFKQIYSLDYIHEHLIKWRQATSLNFYPIFNTIRTLKKFNVADYSATSSLLTIERNDIVGNINNNIKNINRDINVIEYNMKIKTHIDQGKSMRELFPPYNFESVLLCKESAWYLDSMHKAALEIQGGVEFLKNFDGTNSYFNHPIGIQITKHPLVEKCGHSDKSFAWTALNLSYIYKNGWNSWTGEFSNNV